MSMTARRDMQFDDWVKDQTCHHCGEKGHLANKYPHKKKGAHSLCDSHQQHRNNKGQDIIIVIIVLRRIEINVVSRKSTRLLVSRWLMIVQAAVTMMMNLLRLTLLDLVPTLILTNQVLVLWQHMQLVCLHR